MLILSVGQNVANAARSHFVWSTMAMTSRAAATIERLICASSSVASASPDSGVKPAAPRNAFWTLIRLNSPSPSWPTTDSASQRTRPPSIRTTIPGCPASSEAIRRPLVMTVSWLQAGTRLELAGDGQGRRARVHHDALAVMDERGTGRPDPQLLVGLEPLADVERELRLAPVDRDRPAVGADQPALVLEPDEVLADRDGRDVEPGRQVADPGATVLLDDAGDVLLALPGEHVARRGAGWIGHASPLVRIGARAGFRLISAGG